MQLNSLLEVSCCFQYIMSVRDVIMGRIKSLLNSSSVAFQRVSHLPKYKNYLGTIRKSYHLSWTSMRFYNALSEKNMNFLCAELKIIEVV